MDELSLQNPDQIRQLLEEKRRELVELQKCIEKRRANSEKFQQNLQNNRNEVKQMYEAREKAGTLEFNSGVGLREILQKDAEVSSQSWNRVLQSAAAAGSIGLFSSSTKDELDSNSIFLRKDPFTMSK